MVTGHLTQPGNILLLLHFQLKENNVSQLHFYYCCHDSLNEAVASIAPTIIQRCGREMYPFLFFFSYALLFYQKYFFVPGDGSSLFKSWLSLFQFVHHFWLARKEKRITQQFLEMHGFDAGKMQNVIILLCFVCFFSRLPHRLFEKWHFKLAA